MSRFIEEAQKGRQEKPTKEKKPRRLAGDKDYDYDDLNKGRKAPMKRGK